jgi:hypothetical protein
LLCKGNPEFRKNTSALMQHIKSKVKVILLTTKPAFVRGFIVPVDLTDSQDELDVLYKASN